MRLFTCSTTPRIAIATIGRSAYLFTSFFTCHLALLEPLKPIIFIQMDVYYLLQYQSSLSHTGVLMTSPELRPCKIKLNCPDGKQLVELPFICQIPERHLKMNGKFDPSELVLASGDSLPEELGKVKLVRIYQIVRPSADDFVTLIVEQTNAPQQQSWRQIL